MKNRYIQFALLATAMLLLSGCADKVTFEQAATMTPVGFWYGLWHGMTLPFSFFGMLFTDDIAIYAIYNNGGWYDFGFWLMTVGGGGGGGSSVVYRDRN